MARNLSVEGSFVAADMDIFGMEADRGCWPAQTPLVGFPGFLSLSLLNSLGHGDCLGCFFVDKFRILSQWISMTSSRQLELGLMRELTGTRSRLCSLFSAFHQLFGSSIQPIDLTIRVKYLVSNAHRFEHRRISWKFLPELLQLLFLLLFLPIVRIRHMFWRLEKLILHLRYRISGKISLLSFDLAALIFNEGSPGGGFLLNIFIGRGGSDINKIATKSSSPRLA